MINQDVPLESVLKYIKQDRDKFKDKLTKIIPYAKKISAENEQLKDTIVKLEIRIARQEEQIKSMTRETMKSSIYQALQERYNKLKKDKTELLLQIGKMHREWREHNQSLIWIQEDYAW